MGDVFLLLDFSLLNVDSQFDGLVYVSYSEKHGRIQLIRSGLANMVEDECNLDDIQMNSDTIRSWLDGGSFVRECLESEAIIRGGTHLNKRILVKVDGCWMYATCVNFEFDLDQVVTNYVGTMNIVSANTGREEEIMVYSGELFHSSDLMFALQPFAGEDRGLDAEEVVAKANMMLERVAGVGHFQKGTRNVDYVAKSVNLIPPQPDKVLYVAQGKKLNEITVEYAVVFTYASVSNARRANCGLKSMDVFENDDREKDSVGTPSSLKLRKCMKHLSISDVRSELSELEEKSAVSVEEDSAFGGRRRVEEKEEEKSGRVAWKPSRVQQETHDNMTVEAFKGRTAIEFLQRVQVDKNAVVFKPVPAVLKSLYEWNFNSLSILHCK